jgi:prepilin-type N-terminal cleavage/methylation domain-containing protein
MNRSINNFNNKVFPHDRGFTIVELLIVIVVIGILAAIVIVAYNGIQNQARATQAQATASALAKKAEAYNADSAGGNGTYPTALSQMSGSSNSSRSYFVSGISVVSTAMTSSTASPTTVRVIPCTGGGARVVYWDYTTGAESTAAQSPEFGGATDSTACSGTPWTAASS